MERINKIQPIISKIEQKIGANKENYGSFCSLFFSLFPVTECAKKCTVLEKVTVLVKHQARWGRRQLRFSIEELLYHSRRLVVLEEESLW